MKLAFSTLACPHWDVEEIIQGATASGYAGVEWRGYQETLFLPDADCFQEENRHHTRRAFEEAGVSICVLGSSARIGDGQIAEVDAYAALAHDLGCRYVRIFGGKAESFSHAVESAQKMADAAQRHGVSLLLETHDDFSTGNAVARLLREAAHPALFALWDLHHPYRLGESPEETLSQLGPWLRHVHVKDGIVGEGYTLPGEGDLPLATMLALLHTHGYDGFLSVEWEKRWHPDLAEPEIALPRHAEMLSRLISTISG